MLNYKKPAVWISIVSIVLVIITSLSSMINGTADQTKVGKVNIKQGDPGTSNYNNGIPLHFHTVDVSIAFPILGDIKPLNSTNIKKIYTEKSFEGYRVFFYQGVDNNSYVGIETKMGLLTLFQNDTMDPPVYQSSYKISSFTNTLGHDGFKVETGMGAAFELTVYYSVENDQPVYLAYANFAEEVDLDGDGNKEVVFISFSHPSTCFIIKNFDDVIKWSDSIQEILSADKGVEFDPQKQIFTAYWSKEHAAAIGYPELAPKKEFVFSNDKLFPK